MLHVDPGAWLPGTALTYEWLVDGVKLEGESTSSLTLGKKHAGKLVSARVTGELRGYITTTTASADTWVPAVRPDAPATPRVTLARGTATVTWDAPKWDGGAPIQSYTVTAKPHGFTTTVADGTTATITGFEAGTRYTFSVTAMNAAGDSIASAPSAGVLPLPFTDVSPVVGVPTFSEFAVEIGWMSESGISTGYGVGGGEVRVSAVWDGDS